jgi:hypothetical protein
MLKTNCHNTCLLALAKHLGHFYGLEAEPKVQNMWLLLQARLPASQLRAALAASVESAATAAATAAAAAAADRASRAWISNQSPRIF